MFVHYSVMRRKLIANLLFKYFSNNHHLVSEMTGWKLSDLDKEEGLPWPDFRKAVADNFNFYADYETSSVECVYSALNNLSVKSLKGKLSLDKGEECFSNTMFELDYDDYVFWARKSNWTATEVAMLSVGLRPSDQIHEQFNKMDVKYSNTCKLLQEFLERTELYFSAVRADILSEQGGSLEIVVWLEKLELSMPSGLADAVRKYQSPQHSSKVPSDKSEISGSEKRTLLKLIAAMSVENYGFIPSKERNDATGNIRSDLEIVGLSLDNKTILHWLREAAKLVDDKYWEDNS